jgi:hypothetical protein
MLCVVRCFVANPRDPSIMHVGHGAIITSPAFCLQLVTVEYKKQIVARYLGMYGDPSQPDALLAATLQNLVLPMLAYAFHMVWAGRAAACEISWMHGATLHFTNTERGGRDSDSRDHGQHQEDHHWYEPPRVYQVFVGVLLCMAWP